METTIDLEKESLELKTFVSQFETIKFVGEMSALMSSSSVNFEAKKGLSSPLRQLYYLAALNLTSKEVPEENLNQQFSDDDLEYMKKKLQIIENGYDQFFYPEKESNLTEEEWIEKRRVAMPTFLSYFNQGPLNYEEQIIERIIDYFKPFDDVIRDFFKVSVADFIEIYNFIDDLNTQFMNNLARKEEKEESWEQFAKRMEDENKLPYEWNTELPQHTKNFFSFIYDKGRILRFTKDELVNKFGEEKILSLLFHLSIEKKETSFLYYTEPNILHNKPIFKVGEDQYQSIEIKQIIHAIYNLLFNFCISLPDKGEKLYRVRGKALENKIERVFQKFFKNKAYVYKEYFTQDGKGQDLLFLKDGLALIVEAKASKRDEPYRDPIQAYPKILSNFKETISKGYDQTFRVKEKFLDYETLKLYKDQDLKKHIIDIRTKNYHHVFSIVVTLERFGQIQNDLSELLDIFEDDQYPWSLCIDDLEVFLLSLSKLKLNKMDLIKYLKLREQLHGKLFCGDELELCGFFLNGKLNNDILKSTEVLKTVHQMAFIFDDLYDTGLGFDFEKNLSIKTSGNSIKFPG